MLHHDKPAANRTAKMQGKLYAETLEGMIFVKSAQAELTALSVTGEVIAEIPGTQSEDGTTFEIQGDLPAVQYLLRH